MSSHNIKQQTLFQSWKNLARPDQRHFNATAVDEDDVDLARALDTTLRELEIETKNDPAGTSVSRQNHTSLCNSVDGLDSDASKSWIYPMNYSLRQYQYDIVKEALYENTLVILPTGLGKTFIAAVVMYNFYRWYPSCKIVFMAPTRSLVSQQIEACFSIMGIPQVDMVELTGSLIPKARTEAWSSKRIFFLTPQVMMNDLARNVCPAVKVKCLVIDEAHKALGNHAYSQVVTELSSYNYPFRILALSATPGSDIKAVYQVVTNLHISHIEMRTEDSIEIKKYTHDRLIEKVVVSLGEDLEIVQSKFLEIINMYISRLVEWRVINQYNIKSYSKFMLLKLREKYRSNPPSCVSKAQQPIIECYFALSMSLYHAFDLLMQHGVRSFYNFLNGVLTGNKSHPHSRAELRKNELFMNLMEFLEEKLSIRSLQKTETSSQCRDNGLLTQLVGHKTSDQCFSSSHPKLLKLREIVTEHFQKHLSEEIPTRIMIFSQYRDSVNEISLMLQQDRPLVKAMSFIGQNTSGKLKKGLSQKEQLRVMQMFKQGGYNTLVSTCVGEEGLDIGEVDLIICYDAHKSPIRLVQRMGRTGRKRNGKIVMLVTEGKEEQIYRQGMQNAKQICRDICQENKLKPYLFTKNCRMIPSGLDPVCKKIYIQTQNFIVPSKKDHDPTKRKILFEKDCYLTKEEEREYQDKYYLEDNDFCQQNMFTPSLIYFDTGLSEKKNICNRWYLWQSTLQQCHVVSHSHKSELLASTLANLMIPAESLADKRREESAKIAVPKNENLLDDFLPEASPIKYCPLQEDQSLIDRLSELDRLIRKVLIFKSPPCDNNLMSSLAVHPKRQFLFDSDDPKELHNLCFDLLDTTMHNEVQKVLNSSDVARKLQFDDKKNICGTSDNLLIDCDKLEEQVIFIDSIEKTLVNNEWIEPDSSKEEVTHICNNSQLAATSEHGLQSPTQNQCTLLHNSFDIKGCTLGIVVDPHLYGSTAIRTHTQFCRDDNENSQIELEKCSIHSKFSLEMTKLTTAMENKPPIKSPDDCTSSRNAESVKRGTLINTPCAKVTFNMLDDIEIERDPGCHDILCADSSTPASTALLQPNKPKFLSFKRNTRHSTHETCTSPETILYQPLLTTPAFDLLDISPIKEELETTISSFHDNSIIQNGFKRKNVNRLVDSSDDSESALQPYLDVEYQTVKKKNRFLDDEVECIDDVSTDEPDEDSDNELLSSFIDDATAEIEDTSMRDMYLKSVRSPIHAHGRYKLQYKREPVLLSQDTYQDSQYLEDSFCVPDDYVEKSKKRKRSRVHEENRKHRKINSDINDKSESVFTVNTSEDKGEIVRSVPKLMKEVNIKEDSKDAIKHSQELGTESKHRSADDTCGNKKKVIVASREVSHCPTVTSHMRFSHNIEPIIVSIEADYIVSNRMCILRRTWSDFITPSNRMRLISSVWGVCEKFERVFLILEQDQVSKPKSNVSYRTKYADTTICALAHSNMRVLHATGPDQTAHFLAHLASIEQSKGHFISNCRIPQGQEFVLQFYCSIPGVNYITALRLLHRFPLPQQLLDSSPTILMRDLKLTNKCAKSIYRFLRQSS